jgi:dienelactone hydrolase
MIRKLTFLFLFLAVSLSQAQTLAPGPQVLTFFSDADDTEQPYGLYLPKNYDPQKKYPLVIMLHGAGSNHRLSLRRVFGKSNAEGETDVEATRYFPQWQDVDYIVASPYARGTAGYQGIPENDVYDVLADVKKRFSIDEDRIYLTGLSMGGGGTLWIGMTRPDIWAAIAPVCPAPPKGTIDLAMNALNYPAHFFHGDADPAVPVTVSRDWVKKLQELGSKVEYKEYPGVKHDSWVPAYKDEFIFGWFSQFKRNRFPEQVRFATRQYKYDKAYWVQLDRFTPGTLTSIDVKFTAPNQLDIKTKALNAFTLNLAGHPQFKAGQPLQVTVDGKKVKVPSTETLAMSLQNGKWTVATTAPVAAKKPGAEGPISEAFASRHIYVYGTGGNPSEEELKVRREMAVHAAAWSAYRGEFLGRMLFFPRVLADKEVRPSDLESSNLILFGTKATNTLIDKFSDRLPMQLTDAAAKEYGLFYVFPIDKHYVAVNSGLPWWTSTKGESYPMPAAQRVLGDMKDFILFKETTQQVIADGFFDANWKLPEAGAKAMTASGAVTMR